MASRAELTGRSGEPVENTNKRRMESRLKTLFEEYPQHILQTRANSPLVIEEHPYEFSLRRIPDVDKSLYEVELRQRELSDLQHSTINIGFDKDDTPQLRCIQYKSGHTGLTVTYAYQGEGNFLMPDETTIEAGGYTETIYSFSQRNIVRAVGIDLIVEEQQDALAVRDDPDASGFIFPRSINRDKELERFEERLKRK